MRRLEVAELMSRPARGEHACAMRDLLKRSLTRVEMKQSVPVGDPYPRQVLCSTYEGRLSRLGARADRFMGLEEAVDALRGHSGDVCISAFDAEIGHVVLFLSESLEIIAAFMTPIESKGPD